MATSGVYTNTLTRNQIIRQAALLVNAIGAEEPLPSAMTSDFAIILNMLVKRWESQGMKMHAIQECTLFLVPGQYVYYAGTGATDHITDSFRQTETTADAVLSATLLAVDDTTGVTLLDKVGVILDSGTWHWTTVAAFTSSSITLTDPLPDSVDTGNQVFTYTNRIPRPLRVPEARTYDVVSRNETPITVEPRLTYRALPTKRDAGQPVSLFYDPQRGQGVFNIWRVPNVVQYAINFTAHRPLQTFQGANDDPDFPDDWAMALVYNLALHTMAMYPVTPANRQLIAAMAPDMLASAQGAAQDGESIFMQPDMG